ncbi:glycosyl transferase, family 25 [Pseudidiomarina maritima]|uniref:Glycosyl transferase, family 25 n=1 Tax=Pseudidiomarina maritima TaxID=519453 RepID=A0A1I6GU23_9GAMM|nr:glycosyltransferase family 25 protein [Pseudidiomarina maritima]SFR45626.1 glycosyl transferase, family 25 [Pseudidiomarina maritima]
MKQPVQPKFKIFIINLAHSTERWQHVSQQLDKLQLPYERIDAVYGKSLTDSEIDAAFSKTLADKYFHYRLTRGEIGCYLSHVKAWQRIVDESLDFGIVLEDDINFNALFAEVPQRIAAFENAWDVIKLAAPFKDQPYDIIESDRQLNVVHYRRKPPMGACAQAISYAGARQLLRLRPPIFRPVDVDLQWSFELGIQTFGLVPYTVDNTHQHGSEIFAVENRHDVHKSGWRRLKHQVGLYFDNKKARRRTPRL